jgi:hypothetical protein
MEPLFEVPQDHASAEYGRLAGMAEIADLAGLTRQAVTNLRARDQAFPAPIADLRSGPVFRERDVLAYLRTRGKTIETPRYGDVRRKRTGRFDPLDRINLANSVERALLEEPINPLPPEAPFPGAGLYCIYYQGPYEPYAKIAHSDPMTPIYVGRAIPKGARAGVGGLLASVEEPVLFNRLREHARSLQYVQDHGQDHATTSFKPLRLNDFCCRFLVVEDIWVPLAEALLIGHFQPLWNQVLQGFGNHDPGGGRRRGARPDWDELHPGRPWALKQERPGRSSDESLQRIQAHLDTLPQPDLATVPRLSHEQIESLADDE